MKLKPKYDYYLNINGHLFLLPYKIWTEGGHYFIKSSHFATISSSFSEDDVYKKFEKGLHKAIMVYHLAGELWRLLPEHHGLFEAESCRILAYPYRTPFQKWYGRVKERFQNWKRTQ